MLESFPGRSSNFKKCKATSSKWLSESLIQMDDIALGQVILQFHNQTPWFFDSFSSVIHLVQLFVTPWTAACQASLSITNSLSLFKLHWVCDAIQPSHPLLSPSPPAFNLSQPQGLFKWVSFSHQVAKVLGVSASASVLPMNIQDWFPLGWTGWISLLSKGVSRVFSNTTVQDIISLALSFLYSAALTSIHDYWKNHSLD